jgi:hypothetical protein
MERREDVKKEEKREGRIIGGQGGVSRGRRAGGKQERQR